MRDLDLTDPLIVGATLELATRELHEAMTEMRAAQIVLNSAIEGAVDARERLMIATSLAEHAARLHARVQTAQVDLHA